MDEFLSTWVAPFYLRLLHGNYAHQDSAEQQQAFDAAVRVALPRLTPAVVSRLLDGGWRERLTGSWLAGLRGWRQYTDHLGALLLASSGNYAGQGYCFALARFADEASAQHLVRYLHAYLPRPELYYDQAWAMAALLWIDAQLGTAHGGPFVAPGGLWGAFAADKGAHWEIGACRQRFAAVMEYCRVHFDDAAGG
ncbi:hypothetical protein EJV47_05135 [Hymenobacter gummosus]|uniref:Uncharacterized protein n=1 Tax=Hymenobacter gummosus TaxID=1776032 RepID=A0A431U7H1_9BACT|nr:DUF6000 family protein [Hymenobacter gummosus]RTQ52400.1 hypothetical protein EJV47_05135 [Hymenobacter gummosus]